MFSSEYMSSGERHAMKRVKELPPRDCLSIVVSLDSR